MADRVTKDMLMRALADFARAFGTHVATGYDDVGGVALDSAYGGYRLDQIVSRSGGVRAIYDRRLSAREMYEGLRFSYAARSIEQRGWPTMQNPGVRRRRANSRRR